MVVSEHKLTIYINHMMWSKSTLFIDKLRISLIWLIKLNKALIISIPLHPVIVIIIIKELCNRNYIKRKKKKILVSYPFSLPKFT